MSEDWAGPDYCSRAGAQMLAEKLDAYWHGQGFHQVQHWIEQSLSTRGIRTKCWCVRSNLVRGQPPPPGIDAKAQNPAVQEAQGLSGV